MLDVQRRRVPDWRITILSEVIPEIEVGYTLTTKSQVTLPKFIRDHLKVAPGDAVDFRVVADGSVRVVPSSDAVRSDRAADAAALARYRGLKGIGGHAGGSTDALMSMLRGYDDDPSDPGFAAVVPPHTKPPARRRTRT